MKKAHNKNGTVKIMNRLPESWTKENGQDIINFRKSTDAELEALGIFDVKLNPITEHQRYKNSLIPDDFDEPNKLWIMPIIDFTAEEVITHDEQKLDSDETASEEDQRKADGELFVVRLKNRIRRRRKSENLSLEQYKTARLLVFPMSAYLKDGQWDLAKDDIDAIPHQGSAKIRSIIETAQTKIDNYIAENGIEI
jgi:hypothetical protein